MLPWLGDHDARLGLRPPPRHGPRARTTAGRASPRAGLAALAVFVVVRGVERLRQHAAPPRRRLARAVAARQQVPAEHHATRRSSWASWRSRSPPSSALERVPAAVGRRSAAARPRADRALLLPAARPPADARGVGARRRARERARRHVRRRRSRTLVVLFPLCVWYRGYKRAHPDGWTRYV